MNRDFPTWSKASKFMKNKLINFPKNPSNHQNLSNLTNNLLNKSKITVTCFICRKNRFMNYKIIMSRKPNWIYNYIIFNVQLIKLIKNKKNLNKPLQIFKVNQKSHHKPASNNHYNNNSLIKISPWTKNKKNST